MSRRYADAAMGSSELHGPMAGRRNRYEADAASALAELDRRPAVHTYLIAVSFLGADERPAPASDDALDAPDVTAIAATISIDIGYRLSPCGRAFLEASR